MDDELTGLTKGCSIIYTLRLLKHLQFCLGQESPCTVWTSWLPRARRMLLPSIHLSIYFLFTRDDKCSNHLANLFPNFKFCSMCINIFAAESTSRTPTWTSLMDTCVLRRICLSRERSGFQLWVAQSKSPVKHWERISGTTETPKCAFLGHNSLN